jgi:hypothetical protein
LSQLQDLIARIQCTKVQYRDSNLVETNEDSTSDRVGEFFSGLLDLQVSIYYYFLRGGAAVVIDPL